MDGILKRAADLRGFRIAPGDSNDFACLWNLDDEDGAVLRGG